MGRFIRRTWRRTSEKICLANDRPPGFRIVLLDQDGRVKRGDLLVRSGGSFGFVYYPPSLIVGSFLKDAISDHVKDLDLLDFAAVELRDHRDEPVDPNIRLRRVRDMPGADREYGESRGIDFDLRDDIESALEAFEPDIDPRSGPDSGAESLLKSLIDYIVGRFGIDAVDDVLEWHRAMEKARSEGTG